MKETASRARRLVMRVIALQLLSALGCAALFAAGSGWHAALAGFTGGAIAAVGTGIFGWRMFAPGIAAAPRLQRAMLAGEALKWLWLVAGLWLGFAWLRLSPLPLLVGLIVAQFGFWFGLVGKAGKSL